jgi:uncharacterized membrane protein
MIAFNGWENFYVIVGSAAGALIGLQFVVVTLIADTPSLRTAEAGAAFATPTIVHFGATLLLSAVASVPWKPRTRPKRRLLGERNFCFSALCGAIAL